MTSIRRRYCRALVLAAMFTLAACGGTLFQSKINPPSIYLLSAHAGRSGPEIAANLVVLKPQVRAGLDTPRIAALYPDRHLDFYAGAEWSAPLDEVIQQLAVENFRERANYRTVVSDASLVVAGYWLEIEVIDFQAEYTAGRSAPTVHVRLSARLGDARTRRVLGRFEASTTRDAAGNRLAAIIAAYEEAANAALAVIVGDTGRALETKTTGR